MRNTLVVCALLAIGCSSAQKKNTYDTASLEQIASFKRVRLPFPAHTKFFVSQGTFGKESHSEIGNEYSWDFDVPYGTPVVSVEDGVVLEIWEPQQGGGCDPKFSDVAHNIKIEHKDGTVAQYVHVIAKVKLGEQVRELQEIAVTGMNGWICNPQLHFGVYRSRNQLYSSIKRATLPLSFDGVGNLGLAVEGTTGIVPSDRVMKDIKTYDIAISKMTEEFNQIKMEPKNKDWVKIKLKHMYDVDQYMRNYSMKTPSQKKYNENEKKDFEMVFMPRFLSLDFKNTLELKELLKIYPWFTISEFGKDTDKQAWILVQHADHDPQFQKAVLGILTELVLMKETDPSNYAYLVDRVASSFSDPSKRVPQKYGTQGSCVGPGKWEPLPLENPEHIDTRRKEVGLGPHAEYVKMFKEICP